MSKKKRSLSAPKDHIDYNLLRLRINIWNRASSIFTHLMNSYHPRSIPKKFVPRCVFCWSKQNITKEHVMPRWIFINSNASFFESTTNNQNQDYNRTTVPACKECNNEILGTLERYIDHKLHELNGIEVFLTEKDIMRLIRWFEIIEYKFQVMNLIKRFIKHRDYAFDKKVALLPLGVLRRDATPTEVVNQLLRSLLRLKVKNKRSRLNSFLLFKTKNENFHFFHKMDDFIFIELPKHKVAMFYFFRRSFKEPVEAHKAAQEIINRNY